MGVIDILLNWLAPFLDPMNDFRTHANSLRDVHSNSLQVFRELVYQLDPSQALQQNTIISGDFANAIIKSGGDFTQTEVDLSNLVSDLDKLAGITEDFANALSNIMGAVERASLKLQADELLTEVTAEVDVAAVAEAGANPIADIGGFILTLIDGALLLETLKELGDDIQRDIQKLINDLNILKDAIAPPTAQEPKHNPVIQSWKSNPVNVADLTTLVNTYQHLSTTNFTVQQISAIMKGLLQKGLTVDQINTIMTKLLSTGVSNDTVLTFLNGLLSSDGANPDSPKAQKIVDWINGKGKTQLTTILTQYAAIADKEGAGRLLERIVATDSTGYYYELSWADAQKDQIARIEDIAPRRGKKGNLQAADFVMQSEPFTKGAIVDVKSLAWRALDIDPVTNKSTGKYRPMTNAQIDNQVKAFLDQIDRDKTLYKGYPIVYCFDSTKPFPDYAMQEVLAKLPAADVTVMTSPPDKVLAVGQPPVQPASSQSSSPGAGDSPVRSLQEVVDNLRNLLTGGGDGSVPQLPAGQAPPLSLPPPTQ